MLQFEIFRSRFQDKLKSHYKEQAVSSLSSAVLGVSIEKGKAFEFGVQGRNCCKKDNLYVLHRTH